MVLGAQLPEPGVELRVADLLVLGLAGRLESRTRALASRSTASGPRRSGWPTTTTTAASATITATTATTSTRQADRTGSGSGSRSPDVVPRSCATRAA